MFAKHIPNNIEIRRSWICDTHNQNGILQSTCSSYSFQYVWSALISSQSRFRTLLQRFAERNRSLYYLEYFYLLSTMWLVNCFWKWQLHIWYLIHLINIISQIYIFGLPPKKFEETAVQGKLYIKKKKKKIKKQETKHSPPPPDPKKKKKLYLNLWKSLSSKLPTLPSLWLNCKTLPPSVTHQTCRWVSFAGTHWFWPADLAAARCCGRRLWTVTSLPLAGSRPPAKW